ncbi:MAG: protein phosphatase 2C domain-containing protein [Bryobacteraceae bacterium]
MSVASKWKSGAATDRGLVRGSNEDRHWIDDDNGVFLVVDGVGGHAAGEIAAQTAVDTIRRELSSAQGSAEDRVRLAITKANNEIYEMAHDCEQFSGMACVLTLALVDDDQLVIGHVGDTRLYLVWNGSLRKLTSDHSPVGEDEDSGELTEEQAMLHPRRHLVFRDVGTHPHRAGDDDFVEVRRCHFKPDAAFLLCTDGLSDLLPSATIREIVGRYDQDPEHVAAELVQAANEAGGKDNVTALFVAGSEFRGRAGPSWTEARARHSITRFRPENSGEPRWPVRILTGRIAFLLYGVLLGILIWAVLHPLRG